VALHEGHPRITGDGRVVLECGPCSRGERPVVAAVELPPAIVARRRPRIATLATGAGVALIAAVAVIIVLGGESASEELTTATTAVVTEHDVEVAGAAVAEIRDDAPPVPPTPVFVAPPMPERDGTPLYVKFPVLQEWVHPVPGSLEIIPNKASRLFGAKRDHVARRDCGAGHCGVDLEGIRGQSVVAVGWGKVARIQPADVGSGGRYVRIEHPGRVFTTYFHLDDIAPGLEVGAEVEAGEPVGSLGRSGIRVSMPHLHFSLEVPHNDDPDGGVRQIDPAPFLGRAEVLPADGIPDLDHARRAQEAMADPDAAPDGDNELDLVN